MIYRVFVFLLLVFSVHASQGAEPARAEAPKLGALDLIPSSAAAALAIRNVGELTKRGDALIDQADLKVSMRLSDGYRLVVTLLGLHGGLDDNGAAALMALGPKFDESALVLAVPVADVAKMAGNFKLTEKDLADGKIIDRQEREGKDVFAYVRYVALHGRHVYLGSDAKNVVAALTAKTLQATLSEEDRASLAADDIVFYVHREQLADAWNEPRDFLQQELAKLDAQDAETLRKLAAAADDLQFALVGGRLEAGFGATLLMQFKGEKSREILTQLQRSQAQATLAGLPQGRVLAAHASSGDGDASAALVRSLLGTQLFADQPAILSVAHRPNIAGVFGDVWQRLEGSRSALYENEHPERDGQFSLVAILETDHAERFLADMTSLTRFVNAATLTSDEVGQAIDAATIAALIERLGDDEYRERELATTKLGLIGPPALAALQQAAKSRDPEVQYRAQALCERIQRLVARQSEDLLQHDLLNRIQPNFAYFPKQETRAGQSVDIVQMKLRAAEAEYAPQLRRLLGPDWSKLRLAIVQGRIVLLLGSNTALLDQTVKNLQADARGLQADPRWSAFQKRSPAVPTATFHLQLARSLGLMAAAHAPPAPDPSAGMTSLGITIQPQRVRFDLFAPVDEVKSVAAQFQGSP